MSEVEVKKEVNEEDNVINTIAVEANNLEIESQAEAEQLNENLTSESQACAGIVENNVEDITTGPEFIKQSINSESGDSKSTLQHEEESKKESAAEKAADEEIISRAKTEQLKENLTNESPACAGLVENNAEGIIEGTELIEQSNNSGSYDSSSKQQHEKESAMESAATEQQVYVKTEPSELSTEAASQEMPNNLINAAATMPAATVDEPLATGRIANEKPNIEVKAEPIAAATETDEPDLLPDDFFDDLLRSADAISEATRSAAANATLTENAKVSVKTEHVASPEEREQGEIEDDDDDNMPTENFFDDLLVDRMAARLADVANVANEEMEIKYSEQIKKLRKQLSHLEAESSSEQSKDKSHRKHKKAKKKSHKRSREERKSASGERSPTTSVERRQKRSRSSPNGSVSPSGSRHEMPRIRIKGEKDLYATSTSHLPTANVQTRPHTIYEAAQMPSTSAAAAAQSDNPARRLTVKAEFRNLTNFEENIKTATATTSFGNNYGYDDDDNIVDDEDELVECLPVQLPNALFSRRNEATSGYAVPLTQAFTGFKRIKLERTTSQQDIIPASIDLSTDLWQNLTPKMKREKVVERAAAVITEFKKAERSKTYHFLYTATVRKLPSSSSYVHQQIYENRSPLHTINNVSFNFSSYGTRFNLHDWGIEAIPNKAASVARTLGYNADSLHIKRKTIKLPAKLQKVKIEKDANCGEIIDETNSTFFTNAMTQTNEVTVIAGRRHKGHSIGVQTSVHCGEIATQTTEMGQTTTSSRGSNDDLPLMRLMNVLNENQLMALQDFAELILEQSNEAAANAMDMYRLRQRMLEIFKCSQLPSALANNTMQSDRSQRPAHTYNNGAGSSRNPKMSSNNSRPPPAPEMPAFTQQPMHQRTQQVPRVDPRHYSQTHAMPAAVTHTASYPMHQQPPQQQHRNPQPSNLSLTNPPASTGSPTPRYYGRGGLRR